MMEPFVPPDDAVRCRALQAAFQAHRSHVSPDSTDALSTSDVLVKLRRACCRVTQLTAPSQQEQRGGSADDDLPQSSSSNSTQRRRLVSVPRTARAPPRRSDPARYVSPQWLASLEVFASTEATTAVTTDSPAITKVEAAIRGAPIPLPRRECAVQRAQAWAHTYAQHVVHACGQSRLNTTDASRTVNSSAARVFAALTASAAAAPANCTTRLTQEGVPSPLSTSPLPARGGRAASAEAATAIHSPVVSDASSVGLPRSGRTSPADSAEGGLVEAAARLFENTTTMLFSPSARDLPLTRAQPERACGASVGVAYAVHRQRREAHRCERVARWMAARGAQSHGETAIAPYLPDDPAPLKDRHHRHYSFGITVRDLHPEQHSPKPVNVSPRDEEVSLASGELHSEDDLDSERSRPAHADQPTSSPPPRQRFPVTPHRGGRDATASANRRTVCQLLGSPEAVSQSGLPDDHEDDLSLSFFGADDRREDSPAHSRVGMSSSDSFFSYGSQEPDDTCATPSSAHERHEGLQAPSVAGHHLPASAEASEGTESHTLTHSQDSSVNKDVHTSRARGAHTAYLFSPVPRSTPLPPTASTAPSAASDPTMSPATCVLFDPSGQGYLIGMASGLVWYVPSRHSAAPLSVTALGTVYHGGVAASVSDPGTVTSRDDNAPPSAQGRAAASRGDEPAYAWGMEPLRGHSDAITSLDVNDDGSLFCSGSLDGSVILWSTSRRDKVRRMQVAAVPGTSAASVSPVASSGTLSMEKVREMRRDVLLRTARMSRGGKTTRASGSASAVPTHHEAQSAPCHVSFVPMNNNFLLVLTQLPEGALRLFNCSTGLAVAHVAVAPAPPRVLSKPPAKGRPATASTDGRKGAMGFLSTFFATGPATIMGVPPTTAAATRNVSRTSVATSSSSSVSPQPSRGGDGGGEGVTTAMVVAPMIAPFFFTGDASGAVHVWSFRAAPLGPLPTLRSEVHRRRTAGARLRSLSPERGTTRLSVPPSMQPRQLPELHRLSSLALPGKAETARVGGEPVGRLAVATMNAAQANVWLSAATEAAPASPDTDHGAVQRVFQQFSSSFAAAGARHGAGVPRHAAVVDSLMPFMLVASQPADVFHVLALTQLQSPRVASREGTGSETRQGARTAAARSVPHEQAPVVSHALVVLRTVRGVCRLRHVSPWCAPLSAQCGRGGGAVFVADDPLRPVITCTCDEGFVHVLTAPDSLRRAVRRRGGSDAVDTSPHKPAPSSIAHESSRSMMVALASLVVPGGGVCNDIAWSPDARFLVAVSSDGWLHEWERLYLWRGDARRLVASAHVANAGGVLNTSVTEGVTEAGSNGDTAAPALAVASAARDGHGADPAWELEAVEEEERQWRQRVYDARQAQRLAWLRAHPEALSSSNSEEASLYTSRLGTDDDGEASRPSP